MSALILCLIMLIPASALADFSVSVELDEPSAISSSLTLKNQTCIGTNQKVEIKHAKKVCDQISRDYKTLFAKVPDALSPASDEPTARIAATSSGHTWSVTIGRVSGDSPANKQLRSLTNEILKLNAK